MLTYGDRAVSVGASVGIVLFISSLLYEYPETILVSLPKKFITLCNLLCIFFVHEGKLQIITWSIFLLFTVSVFGIIYFAGAVYAGMQKIDVPHILSQVGVMTLVAILLATISDTVVLLYVELCIMLIGIGLCIFLLRGKVYQKIYLHYLIMYMVTAFLASLGASYALMPLFDSFVFAIFITGVYTTYYWVISMFLIFIREFATL